MKKILLLIPILLIAICAEATGSFSVTNLRCEYMRDPLGIDISHPRLSYELLSSGKNRIQSERHILVASSPALLAPGKADVWDSGIVRDRETNQIYIQGESLKPFTFYYWKVRVSDERGKLSAWSDIAMFSTGAMSASDWQAQWIGEDDAAVGRKDPLRHSPLLRKEISITKKVKRAMLYTSAIGIYEARINGKKISRQIFAPEWTVYDAHHQYQTADVTNLLRQGKNVLSAMLADGWYSRSGYGSFARKLIGELHIEYVDNSIEVIPTDSSWRFLPQGPVVMADFFNGEEYDARMEKHGWDMPGYDDSAWAVPTAYDLSAQPRTARSEYILRSQMNEPVSIIMDIKPVSVSAVGDGKYVFDMGQNMVGWCRLSLPYNPGREIRLRYAEVLNQDGTIYTKNLRDARQTDIYHPSDNASIEYEPRFTYHGFRYVEVDGLTKAPAVGDLLGRFVASSSPVAGAFRTSDNSVNKLWENIRYTHWGNLLSVPTDCPQRNERMGWTGDAQTFSQTAIYNLDMAGFYTKWMRDVRDNQSPSGSFPSIAPNRGIEHKDNAPGYADAGHIIPWRLYINYNDTEILAQQYDGMKQFVDFLHRNNPDNLWLHERGRMYGDWLSGDSIRLDDYPKKGGRVPDDVLATAFYANSVSITAKVARVLKMEEDAARYSALADSIRQTFVRKYVSDDGTIEGNTQAGYAIALEYDMLPDALRAKAAQKMADAVALYNYRISTGILTTAFLMKQLSRYGYGDIANRLFLSHDCPSWLYMVDHGATTVWERWDSYVEGRSGIAGETGGNQDPGMNSFNHPALGQVGEWMYGYILGIRYDEAHPGYRRVIINPQPDKSIRWAKGSYHSINGLIEVSWKNDNGRFSINVSVPANTEATIILPDGTTHKVGSGKYFFRKRVGSRED